MYSCIHVFMYSCIHVFMYSCIHVFIYVCIYSFIYLCNCRMQGLQEWTVIPNLHSGGSVTTPSPSTAKAQSRRGKGSSNKVCQLASCYAALHLSCINLVMCTRSLFRSLQGKAAKSQPSPVNAPYAVRDGDLIAVVDTALDPEGKVRASVLSICSEPSTVMAFFVML